MEMMKIENSQEEFAGRSRRHSESPQTQLLEEKKMRREIANSNERRRMKSINAGFYNLRKSVPGADNEKLSKAALLSQTSEYIAGLVLERKRLLSENYELQRMINGHLSPSLKRKKHDTESSEDDGCALSSDAGERDRLLREINDLRLQLEHEKRQRTLLEEQTQVLRAGGNTSLSSTTPAPQPRVDPNKYTCKQRYMTEKQQMREQTEALRSCATPKSPGPVSGPMAQLADTSSLSRKNLDTIIAAIRQIEGDSIYKQNAAETMRSADYRAETISDSESSTAAVKATTEALVRNAASSKTSVSQISTNYEVGMRLFSPQFISQQIVPRVGVVIQTSS